MLIAAAYEFHMLLPGTEITYINIGREITSGQMPDMHRTVGVGQGSRYQISFCWFHYWAKLPERA
jgi:hypothetical protein